MMKSRVESFFVVGNTAALANGTSLYDLSTDALNLAVSQMAIFTGVANSGNKLSVDAATVTSNTQDWIQFIQRRDQSADTSPLTELALNESMKIIPYCFSSAKGIGAAVKANSSWMVGAVGTATNTTSIQSNTEYSLQSGLRGWHVDLYNGRNTPYNQGRYITPDFAASAIYTTDDQRRDLILQEITANYNETSNGQEVALCFDSTASIGAPTVPPAANPNNVRTLASLAALNNGDKIIIGFNDEGQPITLTINSDLKQTFTNMIAGNAAGTWQLVPYARNTAANTNVVGRLIAGGQTAGTPDAVVDHIIFIALDEKRAAYQEISQSKNRIQVGVDGGFTGTATQKLTDASEGAGYANDVSVNYADTQGHNEYIGGKNWQHMHVAYSNEIKAGAIYDVFVVNHCTTGEDTIGGLVQQPLRTTIAVQNFETEGFTDFNVLGAATPNPMKAEIQTAINNWMNSVNFPHTNIAV